MRNTQPKAPSGKFEARAAVIALALAVFPAACLRADVATTQVAGDHARPDAVAAARKALAADPSDKEANLTLGRFLCFEQGDWDAGLRLSARGSDAALREMAEKDLKTPDVTIARTVLGHDWWDYAATQSGEAKVRGQERAAYWYRVTLTDAAAEMPRDERAELGKRVAAAEAEAVAFYDRTPGRRPVEGASVALNRKLLDSAETIPFEPGNVTEDKSFDPGDKPFQLQAALTVQGEKPVTLSFAAGFELRGGTIDLQQRGQLVAKGTPQKPVVFRGVTFSQDLGASLTAENAVFDHCQFNKGGAWFAYESSKWAFKDCVLYASKFGRLTGVDYGFQIRNCALVAMDFPEIAHNRDAGFDHMTRLRGEWNKIEACDFLDCAVPPTVAWCGEGCNFRSCRFVGGEAFDSEKDLDWSAYVTEPAGQGPEAAWAEHPAQRGKVKFVPAEQQFETTHFAGVCPLPEVRYEKGVARLLAPHLKKEEAPAGGPPKL